VPCFPLSLREYRSGPLLGALCLVPGMSPSDWLRTSLPMNPMFRLGLIGLAIAVAVNLLVGLLFGTPAAQFLSGEWWTVWFPTYLVWIVFIIVGLGQQRKD